MKTWFSLLLVAALAGCAPHDGRPGFTLDGTETPVPTEWRFTDDVKEIAIQVHTPYLIPHAVTIWCAQVDGQLYVGSSAPRTRRWPSWVDRDPDVRLGIAGHIYAVRLAPLTAADEIGAVRSSFAAKYQLKANPVGAESEGKFWRVVARTMKE